MATTTNGKRPINIAILGATGAVGKELLRILEQRNFPVGKLKLLGSERSKDFNMPFKGKEYPVEVAQKDSFNGVDVVLSAVSTDVAKEFVPIAVDSGAVVVDKSSAFRMEEVVPLVVQGVNDHALHNHKGIIASPNCTATPVVAVLQPLRELGIERVIVCTYQSVSGAGNPGLEELEDQVQAFLHGDTQKPQVFTKPIAFNVIPQCDSFTENDYTKEEEKVMQETKKMLEMPELAITCTAVRVPVLIGHSEALLVEFEKSADVGKVRNLLKASAMIEVWDNPSEKVFPTALDCAGKDPVFVGRIRKDTSSAHGLHFWVVADNLRVGAALNAVRIAEYLVENKLLRQTVPS
jgi:aspartate-semialdehyde dehydrogenase